MVTMDRIRDLCDRIVREFHPERVILFGSYARGDADENSAESHWFRQPFSRPLRCDAAGSCAAA